MTGAQQPGAQVLVRPSSEVEAAEVMLSDVAAVQCSDQALARKLASVPLCPSPLAGKGRVLTREQIRIALRRQGIADRSVELLCPPQVAVSRRASLISGQTLFEAVRTSVLSEKKWPGTIEVEPVRLPTDQVVPSGKIETKPESNGIRKGRTSVPVSILVNARQCARMHVQVNIRLFAPVLVSTAAIARGSQISAANTAVQVQEVTNLPEDVLSAVPSDGMAAVSISEGTAIRGSMVAERPAVHAGDQVVVIVSGRTVRVSDRGVAASDARIGDRMKVRLLGDVREVRGTVTGPGVVEIDIGARAGARTDSSRQ